MPTTPWTGVQRANVMPASDTDVVVLGSRLQLRSRRHIVGFLVASMRVRKQIVHSPGAIGISMRAQSLRKTFWTLSAWTDQAALDAFVRTSPHTEVMAKYRDRLRDPGFVTWTVKAGDLPPKFTNARSFWREVTERLAPVMV